MTVLEEDLKKIKTVIMQHRGAYTVTRADYIHALESLQRIVVELDSVKVTEG